MQGLPGRSFHDRGQTTTKAQFLDKEFRVRKERGGQYEKSEKIVAWTRSDLDNAMILVGPTARRLVVVSLYVFPPLPPSSPCSSSSLPPSSLLLRRSNFSPPRYPAHQSRRRD